MHPPIAMHEINVLMSKGSQMSFPVCRYSLLLLLVASSAVLGLPSQPDQFYAPPVEQVKKPDQFYGPPLTFPTEPTPVRIFSRFVHCTGPRDNNK